MALQTLKPSAVLRGIKAGTIAAHQRGRVKCIKGHAIAVHTESPAFWENGSYLHCPTCGRATLAAPEFDGFRIDTSGERKRYPVHLTPDPFTLKAAKA